MGSSHKKHNSKSNIQILYFETPNSTLQDTTKSAGILPCGIQQRKYISQKFKQYKTENSEWPNAPCYVSNTTVHTNIKIPLVDDVLKKGKRHSCHQTTITGNCSQPTLPSRQHIRLKRKKHSDLIILGYFI